MSEQIPTICTYRGVGLHEHQDDERLEQVRRDIDAAYSIKSSMKDLMEFVQFRYMSPEARLLARAFILSYVEEQKEKRRKAPDVDIAWLDAVTGGLSTISGRSPTHYDALFAPRPSPGSTNQPVRRPTPLPPDPRRRWR